MKHSNYLLGIILLFTVVSCAKQGTPMGGPKDEDPPKLLSINPSNESTNVKPSIIELEFDEYVKAETPNKQIIITPRINKDEMEVTTNKNRVIINLNQELEDSTTYVFNFQKSIKDITENNIPDNLKLVFSTGPNIDSLSFSGNVSYILPQKQKNITDVLVGLYAENDTTNVLTATPYYIGQTDSIGNFNLSNIKAGNYRAYAWHDQNNSLKAEEKQEEYGFISDTISISENVTDAKLYLSKADLSAFKINRASASGQNFDIYLSKYPTDIIIDHQDINKSLFYRQNEKTIRLYHTSIINDSTAVKLMLRDSVGFKLDTIVYAKFEESDRKNEKLETTVKAKRNFLKEIEAEIKFNKPINNVNYDSLYIKYDSASYIPIKPEMLSFKDSLDRTLISIAVNVPDSLKQEEYTLYAMDSTFQDIEGEFNTTKIENLFRKLDPETLAEEIKITVNTENLPIIVQIIDKKDEVVAEQYLTETNVAIFKNLEAATYYIRAILDLNKNRRWDTSNMNENRQAEPIYYLENKESDNPKDTIIRGGWSLDVTIDPQKIPGIPKIKENIMK
ncbi:Ig-like domain-containing domain [Aquiflexum gelatinilyticum]|uniref:Ig-like domain-containing domain n=1 Tax=Aquiflexum gelatinilyticum TaxID=2961943 RepID=A0A9X2SXZ3_9BACT|nr:Ig-like domain-containing domain [Aquiflexum gelatinilyticum]MCR9014374.1 Ig-like domain-containing domain [Aquiflexum gelatinilyticum]